MLEAQLESARRQLKAVREEPLHPNRSQNILVWEQTIDYILTMIMARDTGLA